MDKTDEIERIRRLRWLYYRRRLLIAAGNIKEAEALTRLWNLEPMRAKVAA